MDTDILIVGSGGAGLVAASAARARGLRVTVVTKARAGYASSTAYAGGGFFLPHGAVSPEQHRDLTVETGRNINIPHMLDMVNANAGRYVDTLAQFGVKIDYGDGFASVSRYAVSPMASGTGLTLPLVKHARQAGVEFVESTMVTGIFTDDRRCTGVRALNARTGEMFSISARAVIMATGGAGRLYSRTDNPVRTTGDGFSLLAEMGLPFIDMEFVQFYPMGFADPGFVVWMVPLTIVEHAPVTNDKGEPFLQDLWRQWGITSARDANAYTRDRSSLAIAREWARGGEVFLHVEDIPQAFWETGTGTMLRSHFPKGRGPDEGPVRVKPVQHYMAGGVRINGDCSTGIPGLYACGELTGGTDGANRVGGNALSMIVVHGFVAAEAAVDYLSGQNEEGAPTATVPGSHPADQLASRWLDNAPGPGPAQIKRRVNAVCDEGLWVLRHQAGLNAALEKLDQLEQDLSDMTAMSPGEVSNAYEARSLVMVSRMVAKAALARTESRGVHNRDDYPHEDQAWMKHVEIRPDGHQLRCRIVDDPDFTGD